MGYFRPVTLAHALDLATQEGIKIIAGGTDVYPAAQRGNTPRCFLDITNIQGFRTIDHSTNGTRIGAAVTWSDLAQAKLPSAFDGIRSAALEIGSLQIQNSGTIVGNICNASPAADGVPALLALNAQLELASASKGKRVIPVKDFISRPRQTNLAKDELVLGISIPPQPINSCAAFEKLGSRRYLVISICMTAANLALDPDGKISDLRIAVGSCSAVAQRLFDLETHCTGQIPSDITITRDHLKPLSPIDDIRGSAEFRLDAVQEQIKRTIQKAAYHA